MQKVLVTGGGGYIGSVLTGLLIEKGYSVIVADAFYWGKNYLNKYKDKLEIIQTDIRQLDTRILNGVDSIIHLAALSNDPMAEFNQKANFEINTQATKELAEIAKKKKIKKFIFSSSASIYYQDNWKKNHLKSETAKVNPRLPYSLSKYQAEQAVLNLADKDFCPVVFRFGTVFGFSPRMRYDLVVNTMVKTALTEKKIYVFCQGKQWRPLIDVKDVAETFVRALEINNKLVKGQIFNVAYANFKMIELAKKVKKAIKKATGEKVEIIVDFSSKEDRSYRISTQKLKKTFGWQPQRSIKQSVKEMIKKIKENQLNDFSNPRYYNIQWMKKRITNL